MKWTITEVFLAEMYHFWIKCTDFHIGVDIFIHLCNIKIDHNYGLQIL